MSEYNREGGISFGDFAVLGGTYSPGRMQIKDTLTIGGTTTVSATTVATSTSTGAVVVAGGAGVGGAIFGGASLSIAGASTLAGAVAITNTTESDSVTTGSTIISGGAAITKNLWVGGTVNGCWPDSLNFVDLVDNVNPGVIIPGTTGYGAYAIYVSDATTDGTAAVIFVTGNDTKAGAVFRVCSTPGSKNESVTVVWNATDQPRLKWGTLPNVQTGATYTFTVRVTPLLGTETTGGGGVEGGGEGGGGGGGSVEIPDPVDTIVTGANFTDDFVGAPPHYSNDEDQLNEDNTNDQTSHTFNGWVVQRKGTDSGYNVNNASYITNNHPGVLTIQTGLANSRTCVHRGLSIKCGAATIKCDFMIKVPVVVSGDEFVVRIGLGDQLTQVADHSNGIYFEYNSAVSNNWLIKSVAADTVTQTITSVAVTTDWFRMRISSTSSAANFFIRDPNDLTFNNVGTITTNLPTTVVSPHMKMDKSAGTAIVTAAMDYWCHQYTGLNR